MYSMISRALQHDMVSGLLTENLLSAILEALAEPTVSYIGLGYDSTVSLNTGENTLFVCVHALSSIFSWYILYISVVGEMYTIRTYTVHTSLYTHIIVNVLLFFSSSLQFRARSTISHSL